MVDVKAALVTKKKTFVLRGYHSYVKFGLSIILNVIYEVIKNVIFYKVLFIETVSRVRLRIQKSLCVYQSL